MKITDETTERAKAAWNSISDEHNCWDALSQDERETYAALTAALAAHVTRPTSETASASLAKTGETRNAQDNRVTPDPVGIASHSSNGHSDDIRSRSSSHCHGSGREKEEIGRAALAVQTQQRVEVKPLDWRPEPPYHVARIFGNLYAVEGWDGGATLSGIGGRRDFSTVTEAKAAAFADYKDRVLALVDVPAVESEPVAWCQPNYEGNIHPRKFMVVYEDAEMGTAVFDDEDEAREHFEKASVAWNCYLFGILPRAQPPRSLSNEGSEIEAALKELADYLDGHHFASERANATKLVSKARTALSTRKGSSEGDGSASTSKGAVE